MGKKSSAAYAKAVAEWHERQRARLRMFVLWASALALVLVADFHFGSINGTTIRSGRACSPVGLVAPPSAPLYALGPYAHNMTGHRVTVLPPARAPRVEYAPVAVQSRVPNTRLFTRERWAAALGLHVTGAMLVFGVYTLGHLILSEAGIYPMETHEAVALATARAVLALDQPLLTLPLAVSAPVMRNPVGWHWVLRCLCVAFHVWGTQRGLAFAARWVADALQLPRFALLAFLHLTYHAVVGMHVYWRRRALADLFWGEE